MSSQPERSGVERPAVLPDARLIPGAPPSSRLHNREDDTEVGAKAPGSTCEATFCTAIHTSTTETILPDAQRRWAARPIHERLHPLRRARHWIAANPQAFANAISPNLTRSEADTLATEVLPLLDAIRFLERNAQKLLAPRKLGRKHRPLWLTGIHAEIHHDPLGHILIISPANYPLFLAGVQTAQALAAGNAVTWKPGTGGEPVARLFAHVLRESGLPRGILRVTDESVESAQTALAEHPNKVIFTGSFPTAQKLLHTLADTVTPATLELSGADAVVVLPSADLHLTAKAIAFGLRLNGAEVCMSPRRLLATRETLTNLRPLLQLELGKLPAVPLSPHTAQALNQLLSEATAQGAEILDLNPGDTQPSENLSSRPGPAPSDLLSRPESTPFVLSSRPERSGVERPAVLSEAPHTPGTLYSARPHTGQDKTTADTPAQAPPPQTHPILLHNATPAMAITRTDLFAPILSLIEAPSVLHLPDLVNNNPYALTAAIFGNPREAQTLATQLRTGTVLINDLIAPTVDPRVPFGGRAHSGYGLTRGAEGLLEMTAAKTLLRRHKGMALQYDPLGPNHLPFFAALIGLLHSGTLKNRRQSLKQLLITARKISPTEH